MYLSYFSSIHQELTILKIYSKVGNTGFKPDSTWLTSHKKLMKFDRVLANCLFQRGKCLLACKGQIKTESGWSWKNQNAFQSKRKIVLALLIIEKNTQYPEYKKSETIFWWFKVRNAWFLSNHSFGTEYDSNTYLIEIK